MLARGRADAEVHSLSQHLKFTQADFNNWNASTDYEVVVANQSLHHVISLEHLFDAIKSSLHPKGLFLTSDMSGRNGHMRWPESLTIVQRFWQALPESYRYNQQLRRHEARYKNCGHSRKTISMKPCFAIRKIGLVQQTAQIAAARESNLNR